MRVSRFLSWAGLLACIAFLTLQFVVSIQLRLADGETFVAALWALLTFFTILSNIGIMLVHAGALTANNALSWLRHAHVRTMFAVLILMVMVVYHFVLAPLWQPAGLFLVAQTGLHYITPLIYLAWWGLYPREKAAQFHHMPLMLVPPILYLVWALARGLMVGEYPYPFLDLGVLGAAIFARNVVGLFLAIAVLYAFFIVIEKRLPRR